MGISSDKKELFSFKEQIAQEELFQGENFRVAPVPLALKPEEIDFLERLGDHVLNFMRTCNLLHRRAWKGEAPDWITDYLDRGKPERIVQLARQKKFNGDLPLVLRPDLLLTENGFSLTELDSVPGGIGLSAFLNDSYQKVGYPVYGADGLMVTNFLEALQEASGKGEQGVIAICVSEESAMYRPEMHWLAGQFAQQGARVFVVNPGQMEYHADGVYAKGHKIDLIYRFFELFDLPNLENQDKLLEALETQRVRITPPIKPALEEKMWLGLFQNTNLRSHWRRELGDKGIRVMEQLIPVTNVMDPSPLPPHATIYGLGIHDWERLKTFSQKERDWIIKISGFSELAWGAKGVFYGSDMSSEDWAKTIEMALESFKSNPYIIQKFTPAKLIDQTYIDQDGSLIGFKGRARVCPYYFVVGGKARLSGILATVCPADKKLIHGMDVAVLSPVQATE